MTRDRYSYRVSWSDEDSEFVGICAEFPSLSWLARTPESALRGIRRVVALTVRDLEKNGEDVPEPISTRKFSGRFVVRVPPDVHRRLVREARENRVSLNRLVSSKLAG